MSTSPATVACTNAAATSGPAGDPASTWRTGSRTRRRARLAIWRHAAGDLPTMAAMSANGSSNTSASRNTARSTGVSRSSIVRKPRVSESASSADSAGPGRVGDRLGQPRADVGLALVLRRAQPVDGQPGHHRREPRRRALHLGARPPPSAARRPAPRPRRRSSSRGGGRPGARSRGRSPSKMARAGVSAVIDDTRWAAAWAAARRAGGGGAGERGVGQQAGGAHPVAAHEGTRDGRRRPPAGGRPARRRPAWAGR